MFEEKQWTASYRYISQLSRRTRDLAIELALAVCNRSYEILGEENCIKVFKVESPVRLC